ncbi:MAG: FGGY-family carbohydrate kinase [Verrucomicrobiota bacterium]
MTPISSSDRLVIGLDASTQSAKAVAWDRQGRVAAQASATIPISNPRRDYFVQNPYDWWRAVCNALHECLSGIDPARVDALAIAHQRETVAFLDSRGESIYPAILWLDERSRPNVRRLSAALGADTIHRITGRYPDVTPTFYRFDWMRHHEPKIFANTACFADVQCYLIHRLAGGPFRTGWLSADGTGVFDLQLKAWSPLLLDAVGLSPDRLPEPLPPGSEIGRVSRAASAETGLPEGLPLFAGGGDGHYAGLGTNCTIPERAYVSLGTSVVSGTWSPDYRHDRTWRTLLAAQGEGYIYESVQRSGSFLLNWFVDHFIPEGRKDPTVFRRMEMLARQVPIGCEGLMIQPYWSGAMDPYWDSSARGVTFGQSASHRPAHFYRAILEAITFDQVMRSRAQEKARGRAISHYVAIGGGAASTFWCQLLADASGKPVLLSGTVEASALGAAMTAAYGAGWYPSITAAAQAMAEDTRTVNPDPSTAERYEELLSIHHDLYHATAHINRRLVDYANRNP